VRQGRGSFRWPLPNEVVIINYDILPEAMARAPRPGTVIIADEAHALKSSKTNRTKRFRALAARSAPSTPAACGSRPARRS
jgi:hypothetical protein